MSKATHGGKGDKPRPVDKEQYDENFDKIFKGGKDDSVTTAKQQTSKS